MWFLLIIILLVPVNGYTDICGEDPKEFCHNQRLEPDSIPKDYEDLKRRCPQALEQLACHEGYGLACDGRSDYVSLQITEQNRKIRAFIEQACKRGSSINRALGIHLPCINSRVPFSDYICSTSRDNVLRNYEDYYSAHSAYRSRVSATAKKQERRDCLSSMYTIGCVLKNIEKDCGYKAYDVAMDLVRSRALVEICGIDIFQEITEILDDMRDMDSENMDILKKMFLMRH